MCKDQLCVKHAKFLRPFLSINHQNTKPDFFLLDILSKLFFFLGGGGGSWRVWGGSFPPAHPIASR